MTEPFTRLPDVDSITGMQITGQIVEIQYEHVATRTCYALSMTLPNALFVLSLLSNLPGADQTLARAKEFATQPRPG